MTYASIMVAVDPGEPAGTRVRLAGHLADAFKARLIGVAAEQPAYAFAPIGPTPGSTYVLPELQEACQDRLNRARAVFDEATSDRLRVEWRSAVDDPLTFIVRQALCADLVVVGRPGDDPETAAANPGELAIQLGRPLLVAPASAEKLEAACVAIGWKNTREARRAVWDAMPFLKRASKVIVCTVNEGDARDDGQEVVHYLAAQGIDAVTAQNEAYGISTAEALIDVACECAADLLVTGAYGHSRLREWMFGGVTRDLLAGAPICWLLSH